MGLGRCRSLPRHGGQALITFFRGLCAARSFILGPHNAGVSRGQIFNLQLWISCLPWGGGQILPPSFLSSQHGGLWLPGANMPWETGKDSWEVKRGGLAPSS